MKSGKLLFHILRTQKPPAKFEKALLKFSAPTFTRNFSTAFSNFTPKRNLQNNLFKCTACQTRCFSTENNSDVEFSFQNGLPVINIPLPSRKEMCKFILRPVASTVGDFLSDIQREDQGIDRAVIFSTDGSRVASSTQIEHLLQDSFVLHINNQTYEINPPKQEQGSSESIETLDDTKMLIAKLYSQLHVNQHQLKKERSILQRLEHLKAEMLPYEQERQRLSEKATKRTNYLMWGGLAGMGLQFGILARLTWWEYSWDIMEPVTYFITYGTAIVMYGYFLLTQQEYVYPDARDRQYMRFFYKQAEKNKFDVEKYNKLCIEVAQTEQDLKRLRDPLQLHIPPQPISVEVETERGQP